jgi:aminodeoxyfutalosine synthase
MAGATSPQLQTEADMIKAIREAGRTPVQRNSFYEPIKILETLGELEAGFTPVNAREENLAPA